MYGSESRGDSMDERRSKPATRQLALEEARATQAQIEVTWPSSVEQSFPGVPADRTVLIVEGDDELVIQQ